MIEDLVTWLRAQLDDDERVARAADSSRWLPEDKGITFEYHADDFHQGEAQARLVADTRANQEHIARHDPARVLAELDAKRRILDAYADAVHMHRLMDETDDAGKWDWLFKSEALEGVLKLLALPYADRPGYRPEWKP